MGHTLTINRVRRGRSPTFNRPLYGTAGRCECGEPFGSNEAPSTGGRRDVVAAHAHHTSTIPRPGAKR